MVQDLWLCARPAQKSSQGGLRFFALVTEVHTLLVGMGNAVGSRSARCLERGGSDITALRDMSR